MEEKELQRITNNAIKQKHRMSNKLGVKTKALWFAAGIIADNNLQPGANQQQVYEMLKVVGNQLWQEYQQNLKNEVFMDLVSLLASDSYIIYNKEFASKYGVEEAILLGAMCSYQKSFNNEEFLEKKKKFPKIQD